jgi:predicted RNase H-like nuclease (RuvC/YqgF family)
MKTLTVLEYAQEIGVAPATVYRRIDRGELQAICEDGVKKIVVPDEKHRDTSAIQNENMVLQAEYLKDLKRQIERLEVQNEELLHELQESRQREDGARQRADTIILSLTRQFEEQNKLLEDMRQPREAGSRKAGRSLWSRVKTAFRFAAS